MKAGAADFVLKPWQNDKFLDTIRGAIRNPTGNPPSGKTSSSSPTAETGSRSAKPTGIIGPAMRPILDTVAQVAPTDANVLILGENGTGKDLIARVIHEQSDRHSKPFVPVDVGALTESLFESELFGHVKGAFTDARDDRAGRFEEANGGTIFLDEIGNLTPTQQARLLTVLQQRQVTRVGSNKARPVDVRLICATNADLHERVADKLFRQDLLYRINTIELALPPLRNRPTDIGPLADYFVKKYAKQYNRPVTGLSPALLVEMKQYAWPGNVRELQHAIERAVILGRGPALEPADFVFRATALNRHIARQRNPATGRYGAAVHSAGHAETPGQHHRCGAGTGPLAAGPLPAVGEIWVVSLTHWPNSLCYGWYDIRLKIKACRSLFYK